MAAIFHPFDSHATQVAIEANHRMGRNLAIAASILLIVDTVFLAAAFAVVLILTGLQEGGIKPLLAESPLPLVLYLIWGMGLAGTVAAITSIGLYGYRERWFWRCLLIASIAWLIFPPMHTIIGLLSLILLIRSRRLFPEDGAHPSMPWGRQDGR